MVAAGKIFFYVSLVFLSVWSTVTAWGWRRHCWKKRISDFPLNGVFLWFFPFFKFYFLLLKKLLNTKIKNLIFAFLDAVPVHGRMRTYTHVGLEYGQNQFRKWYKFKPAFPLYNTYYIGDKNKVLVGFHAQNVAVCWRNLVILSDSPRVSYQWKIRSPFVFSFRFHLYVIICVVFKKKPAISRVRCTPSPEYPNESLKL